MLRNYLTTTIRNLIRNRSYAVMNILGLTVGIACFSLISLYVEDQFSHDQFHPDNIYRFLITEQTGDGETRTTGITSDDIHYAIADNTAGIEELLIARDYIAGPLLVEYKDVKIKTRRMMFSQPAFFDFFGYELLKGDPKTVIKDPNSVVITESTAKRYFGDVNPIGETLKFSGNFSFSMTVTGVMKDPVNSFLDFDFLMPYELRVNENDADGGFRLMPEGFKNSLYGFYRLAPGTTPEEAAERTRAYFLEAYKDRPDVIEVIEKEGYSFQVLSDIYFGSEHVSFYGEMKKGDKQSTLILGLIGLFILLVACMNYINAATAKSINRAKEIGVRKVFGAYKSQLIYQFLAEAFLITFIAVVLSVLLTDLSLPAFENLMETQLRYDLIANPTYQIGLVVILVAVTLLSGTYPAFILSQFKPSDSLKANAGNGALKGNGLRSMLVGIQLFLTMALISGVLLILKQSNFIQNRELGYDVDDIVIIPNNSDNIEKELSTFENELLKSPYIKKVTSGVDVMGFENTNNSGRAMLEGQDVASAPITTFFTVQKDFLDVQGLELIDGRDFDPNMLSDTMALIVNEAYARAVGIEDIVGKKVRLWSPESTPQPIIGVVKDFNFKSLRSEVSPVIFMVNERRNWFFTVKIDANNKQKAIEHARASWVNIEPNYPMGYMFLEDNLNDYYGAEQRLYSAIQTFSIICVFIACLGLYGMTAFTIERRNKEIGIRKVLGANVSQLIWLINSRFVRIVLIASIMAIPVVYFMISQWLESFAYHINIGWSSFAIALLIVTIIVGATVSSLALLAGVANPSKTLRSE